MESGWDFNQKEKTPLILEALGLLAGACVFIGLASLSADLMSYLGFFAATPLGISLLNVTLFGLASLAIGVSITAVGFSARRSCCKKF